MIETYCIRPLQLNDEVVITRDVLCAVRNIEDRKETILIRKGETGIIKKFGSFALYEIEIKNKDIIVSGIPEWFLEKVD